MDHLALNLGSTRPTDALAASLWVTNSFLFPLEPPPPLVSQSYNKSTTWKGGEIGEVLPGGWGGGSACVSQLHTPCPVCLLPSRVLALR